MWQLIKLTYGCVIKNTHTQHSPLLFSRCRLLWFWIEPATTGKGCNSWVSSAPLLSLCISSQYLLGWTCSLDMNTFCHATCAAVLSQVKHVLRRLASTMLIWFSLVLRSMVLPVSQLTFCGVWAKVDVPGTPLASRSAGWQLKPTEPIFKSSAPESFVMAFGSSNGDNTVQ